MRRELTFIALLSVIIAGNAFAQCSSKKCSNVGGTGQSFFVDFSCDSGTTSCVAPATGCDTCPGHCLVTPEIECISDSQCPGSSSINPCKFDGNFGRCTATSEKPGAACVVEEQCSADGVSACPGCCELGVTPYGGDGACTVSGTSGVNEITGSDGDDVICGLGGDDEIDGGDGNDILDGGNGDDTLTGGLGNDTLYGGNNDDDLFATAGDNFLDGGKGLDVLAGADGDDVLLGGDDTDVIVGQGGRDVLKGQGGDDTLVSNFWVIPADDVLGSVLCGGDGNDQLIGNGPGHQCLDGGPDQAPASGTFDCTYANLPDDGGAADVGTSRNCANPGSGFSSRTPGCGCD